MAKEKKNSEFNIKFKAFAERTRKSTITLSSLVVKSVKNQYRRSVLGIIWTVLNPLLTMLVMAFVFHSLFGRKNINMDYPVYILSGNIVFTLVTSGSTNAMTSIVNNYDLIYKTRVPYSVFPLAQVFTSCVNFLFALIALIIVMLIRIPYGVTFHWTMLMSFIPWLPAVLLFTIGIGLFLSALYVRFRDIKHIYLVFTRLWMYLTPIFYSLSALKLSDSVMKVMKLNPMLYYINYFRDVISGTIPDGKTHAIIIGVGLLSFAIGAVTFRLSRNKFVLHI